MLDSNPTFNKWIWQLRDDVDEADDALDEFEYMKHKQQLTQNTEETKLGPVARRSGVLSSLLAVVVQGRRRY